MLSLARFIRDNKEEILYKWRDAVSTLPAAQGTSLRDVMDHMPAILDSLAEAIERDDLTTVPLKGFPNVHAALRVREGYDLRQVVAEYRVLRRVIHELYSRSADISVESQPNMRPLTVMHAALDYGIADAVDQFALDRERAREMFIAMLGHDLREPLHAILVGAEFLTVRGEDLDPAAQRIARQIRASAERMSKLIGDLLDFAHGRLGSGVPIVTARIDARPVIQSTVAEILHAHPERTIRYLADRAADFIVEWDGDRIAQAITNLVSNAITHGADPIVIELLDEGDRIAIHVRNSGEIPPQVMPHLFSPFSHAGPDRRRKGSDPERDRRRGSLGLGLYIVREIAHAHGGDVRARSEGGATDVSITLPRFAKGH